MATEPSRATPRRHYYLQSARGNRLFELGLGPVARVLCGTSGPEADGRVDALLAEHGETGMVRQLLADAGLGWAAELIGRFPESLSISPEESVK